MMVAPVEVGFYLPFGPNGTSSRNASNCCNPKTFSDVVTGVIRLIPPELHLRYHRAADSHYFDIGGAENCWGKVICSFPVEQ